MKKSVKPQDYNIHCTSNFRNLNKVFLFRE